MRGEKIYWSSIAALILQWIDDCAAALQRDSRRLQLITADKGLDVNCQWTDFSTYLDTSTSYSSARMRGPNCLLLQCPISTGRPIKHDLKLIFMFARYYWEALGCRESISGPRSFGAAADCCVVNAEIRLAASSRDGRSSGFVRRSSLRRSTKSWCTAPTFH